MSSETESRTARRVGCQQARPQGGARCTIQCNGSDRAKPIEHEAGARSGVPTAQRVLGSAPAESDQASRTASVFHWKEQHTRTALGDCHQARDQRDCPGTSKRVDCPGASSQNEQPTGNSRADCPTSVTEEEWYRPDTHSTQLRRSDDSHLAAAVRRSGARKAAGVD